MSASNRDRCAALKERLVEVERLAEARLEYAYELEGAKWKAQAERDSLVLGIEARDALIDRVLDMAENMEPHDGLPDEIADHIRRARTALRDGDPEAGSESSEQICPNCKRPITECSGFGKDDCGQPWPSGQPSSVEGR